MRILLINHGTAGDYGGGDGTQIKNTAQQLRAVGHDVSMVNSDEPDVRGFDIAHIFNCRVVESAVRLGMGRLLCPLALLKIQRVTT